MTWTFSLKRKDSTCHLTGLQGPFIASDDSTRDVSRRSAVSYPLTTSLGAEYLLWIPAHKSHSPLANSATYSSHFCSVSLIGWHIVLKIEVMELIFLPPFHHFTGYWGQTAFGQFKIVKQNIHQWIKLFKFPYISKQSFLKDTQILFFHTCTHVFLQHAYMYYKWNKYSVT